MKKPTSNGNDLYQIGNDYPQTVAKYFKPESYKDGIYTELKEDFNPVTGAVGKDDPFFDLKDAKGLNKRVFDVLPQSGWEGFAEASATSAFLLDDYATGVVSADLGEV